MKKILFAIGSSEIGGGQKLFLATVKEFLRRNYSLVIVLPNGPLVEEIKTLGIKFHIVHFHSIKSLLKIAFIVRFEKIDVINAYLTKCSLFFALVNIIFRVPLCCTLLNAITHEKLNKLQKMVYPLFYYLLYKLADGIIVNSEQNKSHFISVARMNANKVKVIYSGIDIDKFSAIKVDMPKSQKFVIGAVGRLSPEKGHIYLLNALTHLKNFDFECVIVGDGPLRFELEEFVRQEELNEKVSFLGFRNDVAQIMSSMDVVVLPSLDETFGLTIVEAFVLKKIVIASNVGGIPELVSHNSTGLLFPARDSVALAEAIEYAYNNKEKLYDIANNAHQFAINNFTTEIMVSNTLDYYNFLLRKDLKEE